MSTATAPRDMASATSLLVENVRIYLQVKNAFEQCDEAIQAVVTDMIEIMNDDEATAEEQQRAMYTIVEALFPSLAFDFLQICDRVRTSKKWQANWDELGQQEASFATNLDKWMKEKDFTQEKLAKKIGVGQPAIANMLNRNCRPQRKTVVRIADALGIAPTDLWPGFKAD